MQQIITFDKPRLSDRIYRGDPDSFDRPSVKFRLYVEHEHYRLVAPERMVSILEELLPDLTKKEQKKCNSLISKILSND